MSSIITPVRILDLSPVQLNDFLKLLDEPTSSLDKHIENELYNLLHRLNKQLTKTLKEVRTEKLRSE